MPKDVDVFGVVRRHLSDYLRLQVGLYMTGDDFLCMKAPVT